MQGLSGVAITSIVAMAADAKDRAAVVSEDVAILAQAHIYLQAENVRLRKALSDLVLSAVGKQTLHKLHEGQGTDTEDGRAWLRADEMVTPNGEVRGASRPAGEASSAEGATSTVVLERCDGERT